MLTQSTVWTPVASSVHARGVDYSVEDSHVVFQLTNQPGNGCIKRVGPRQPTEVTPTTEKPDLRLDPPTITLTLSESPLFSHGKEAENA